MDVEIIFYALKSYAKDPDRDYKKLCAYADEMNIGQKVDGILEVLV